MTHVKGMWMVIAVRGGISTLTTNQDLMLMISWYGSAAPVTYAIWGILLQMLTNHFRVDITAALLHDTKPLFPLSVPMVSTSVFRNLELGTLPAPLLGVINDENAQNTRFMSVLSCIVDLNALAAFVRFELATKGHSVWDDEEQMGGLMNPVTYRLLDQPFRSEPVTRWDIISEALRLGAIIWIIRVKRRCRSYPGTAEARISTLLQILSIESNAEHIWDSPHLRLVRLWLLILCSISEPSEKDLATLMEMIASEMKEQRGVSWAEIMTDIRQMPWVDIFEPPCVKLEQRLRKDYLGHQFELIC
jgi:hypothetical protein